jgi:hypothetical protein
MERMMMMMALTWKTCPPILLLRPEVQLFRPQLLLYHLCLLSGVVAVLGDWYLAPLADLELVPVELRATDLDFDRRELADLPHVELDSVDLDEEDLPPAGGGPRLAGHFSSVL